MERLVLHHSNYGKCALVACGKALINLLEGFSTSRTMSLVFPSVIYTPAVAVGVAGVFEAAAMLVGVQFASSVSFPPTRKRRFTSEQLHGR